MLLFFVALAAGFASSIPPGPINLAFAAASLRVPRFRATAFVLGVILVDVAFAGLAMLGASHLEGSLVLRGMEGGGGALLTILGVGILYLGKPQSETTPTASLTKLEHTGSAMATGAALCGMNPGFLLFWCAVVPIAQAETVGPGGPLDALIFAAGVFVGDALWFLGLARLLTRIQPGRRAKAANVLRWLAGACLILSGIISMKRGFHALFGL